MHDDIYIYILVDEDASRSITELVDKKIRCGQLSNIQDLLLALAVLWTPLVMIAYCKTKLEAVCMYICMYVCVCVCVYLDNI